MLVTKQLKDIAFKYADLSAANLINEQFFPKAYITGNLYARVRGYNDVSRMLKEQTEGKIVLALNYAPPGAEYGKFVHGGHMTRNIDKSARRFIEGRPYAYYAANSTEIKALIDTYVKDEMDKKVGKMMQELDVQLSAFSKR